MSEQEQLERERRLGRWAAAAAGAAIALTVAALVIQAAVIKPVTYNGHTIKISNASSTAQGLILTAKQPSTYLVLQIVGALALPLIGLVLIYLYEAARLRRPQLPGWLRWALIAAPLAAAALSVANQVRDNDAAKKFVHLPFHETLGKAGDTKATDLLQHTGAAIGAAYEIVQLLFAIAVIFTCIQAMRTGLLSRGMGFFGAFIGVEFLIPIAAILNPLAPIIFEIAWLGAVATIFLDRWPGGRGPAWSALEPIPWPTAAQRRAEMDAARGGGNGGQPENAARSAPPRGGGALARAVRAATREDQDDGAGAATAVSDEEPPDEVKQHPRSKKRKRKRRG